jgi:hypothetical protein
MLSGFPAPHNLTPTPKDLIMKVLWLIAVVLAYPLLALGQSTILDTTHLGASAGTGFAAHVAYCQTLLPASGGTCDGSYEPAQTTLATVTISSSNVVVILPPVTLTLGNGFLGLSVTASNSGFVCLQQWSCVLDASNNGGNGTISMANSVTATSGDFANNIKLIGGRLNKQAGNEVVMTGTAHQFTNSWSVNAGRDAVTLSNCNSCIVQHNIIDQSGAAAIIINTNSNSSTSNYNDIGFNLTRDANVNVGQNTQGTIGASCNAGNCTASLPTAHLADYNNFHDNVILNQYFFSGNCNNPNVGPLTTTGATGTGS